MSLLQTVAGTNASNAHSPAPSLPSSQGCVSGVGCSGTGVCGQKGGANNKNNAKKNNAKKNNAKKNNAKKNNAKKINNKKNNKINKNNKNNKNNTKKNNNKKNSKNNKNNSKMNNTKKNNNKKNNQNNKNNKNNAKKNNAKKNNGILIKCQRVQRGGGYGFTDADAAMAAKSGMGYGSMPFSSYTNCGTSRAASMGAGIQHGGALPLVPSDVNSNSMLVKNPPPVNNNLRPGYGYVSGKDNLLFAGSGYPMETPYNGNSCAQGGGRRKKRKSRRHRKKGTKKHRRRRHTRKGGYVQKGGYSQYQSNIPNTPSYSQPNPGGSVPWATGPGSFKPTNHCVDNYNHFTGKGSPSPVLDKGVSQ